MVQVESRMRFKDKQYGIPVATREGTLMEESPRATEASPKKMKRIKYDP
jgi:hypothetical protein